MIIDMEQPVMADGLIAFPDWGFAVVPLQSSQIKETVLITGRSDASVSITGNADAPEN